MNVLQALTTILDAWIMPDDDSYVNARRRLRNDWPTLATALDNVYEQSGVLGVTLTHEMTPMVQVDFAKAEREAALAHILKKENTTMTQYGSGPAYRATLKFTLTKADSPLIDVQHFQTLDDVRSSLFHEFEDDAIRHLGSAPSFEQVAAYAETKGYTLGPYVNYIDDVPPKYVLLHATNDEAEPYYFRTTEAIEKWVKSRSRFLEDILAQHKLEDQCRIIGYTMHETDAMHWACRAIHVLHNIVESSQARDLVGGLNDFILNDGSIDELMTAYKDHEMMTIIGEEGQ